MRTIAEIAQEHFGVSTRAEACKVLNAAFEGADPPGTTTTYLTLPYKAENLPELPTTSEWSAGFKEARISHITGQNIVCRVGSFVCKIGPRGDIIEEAETLIWLAENSQVRVPKVYEVCECEPKPSVQFAIIMEYIEGTELRYQDWKNYSEEERTTLCLRIGEQFRLLRAIPSEGYYGRVHHQGWSRKMGMFRTNTKQNSGPYERYEDFTAAVICAAEVNAMTYYKYDGELTDNQLLLISEYKRMLEKSTDRTPVFTHVDPALKNILIRRIPATDEQTPDWEVTLIDWAGAGWFPGWVQEACFEQRLEMYNGEGYSISCERSHELIDRFYKDMKCGADFAELSRRMISGLALWIY